MVRRASNATERLDKRMYGRPSTVGALEVEELREALERVQALSLENNEELDGYQQLQAR